MKNYKSQNEAKMNQYNIMLALARDKSSTLYNSDGSQNRAASHRAHFWNGYTYGMDHANIVPEYESIAYCIFRAGMDFAKEETSSQLTKKC